MAMRKKTAKTAPKKSAMDIVKLARDAKRPHLMDFIQYICSDF